MHAQVQSQECTLTDTPTNSQTQPPTNTHTWNWSPFGCGVCVCVHADVCMWRCAYYTRKPTRGAASESEWWELGLSWEQTIDGCMSRGMPKTSNGIKPKLCQRKKNCGRCSRLSQQKSNTFEPVAEKQITLNEMKPIEVCCVNAKHHPNYLTEQAWPRAGATTATD